MGKLLGGVAKCIAKQYTDMASHTNLPITTLKKEAIKATQHDYPKQEVQLHYTFKVGDVFKPYGFVDVRVNNSIVSLTPLMEFVIYKLSCSATSYPVTYYDQLDRKYNVKSIVLCYTYGMKIVGNDLNKFSCIYINSDHTMLETIGTTCGLSDNIADLLAMV